MKIAYSRRQLTFEEMKDFLSCLPDNQWVKLDVALRGNSFLRRHGLSKFQMAIPKVGLKASFYNFHDARNLLRLLIRYRQNPFCGLVRKSQRKNSTKGILEKEELTQYS